tara:strand:+ start:487 stop:792 length:306 start_codon:yes stop_codon:yes gene_type:complete
VPFQRIYFFYPVEGQLQVLQGYPKNVLGEIHQRGGVSLLPQLLWVQILGTSKEGLTKLADDRIFVIGQSLFSNLFPQLDLTHQLQIAQLVQYLEPFGSIFD